MRGGASATLPGKPGAALQAAYGSLSPSRRAAMLPHLLGDTGSGYLADWFKRAGSPIGKTSILDYRRSLAHDRSVTV